MQHACWLYDPVLYDLLQLGTHRTITNLYYGTPKFPAEFSYVRLFFRFSCFLAVLAFLFWFSIFWVFRRETLLIVASPFADFLAVFLPKAIRLWPVINSFRTKPLVWLMQNIMLEFSVAKNNSISLKKKVIQTIQFFLKVYVIKPWDKADTSSQEGLWGYFRISLRHSHCCCAPSYSQCVVTLIPIRYEKYRVCGSYICACVSL